MTGWEGFGSILRLRIIIAIEEPTRSRQPKVIEAELDRACGDHLGDVQPGKR